MLFATVAYIRGFVLAAALIDKRHEVFAMTCAPRTFPAKTYTAGTIKANVPA